MKACIFLLCLSFLLNSCAGLTPAQKAFIDKTRNAPLEFTIGRSESDAAWSKAQVWLTHNSTMKIQTATDYVIETHVAEHSQDIKYVVTRALNSDGALFKIQATPLAGIWQDRATENARILSHYIRTGEDAPVGTVFTCVMKH